MNQPGKPITPIRVFIIDDHPIVRESIAAIISQQPDMVVSGSASSKRDVYAAFTLHAPDVAIVDVALADSHGLELIQDLRTQFEDSRFVVFSMYDERLYAERAVKSGAHGYVMKSQSAKMLVQAVRMASTNDYYLSKSMLSMILRQMGPHHVAEPSGPSISNLTTRELEVFQMIGQGQDASKIADRLALSRKTVETYRRRIKEKLDLDSLTELLHHAMRWTDSQSRS